MPQRHALHPGETKWLLVSSPPVLGLVTEQTDGIALSSVATTVLQHQQPFRAAVPDGLWSAKFPGSHVAPFPLLPSGALTGKEAQNCLQIPSLLVLRPSLPLEAGKGKWIIVGNRDLHTSVKYMVGKLLMAKKLVFEIATFLSLVHHFGV